MILKAVLGYGCENTGIFFKSFPLYSQRGEEIGEEVHRKADQFFRIEQGEAKIVFNKKEEHVVHDGDAVIVPAGTFHNVINTGKGKLKLYTIYSPRNRPDGTVHKTKAEADKAEEEEHPPHGVHYVCHEDHGPTEPIRVAMETLS